tara:strand:- start:112371 stop:113903 length:1533 start_codon:yes stop_codon:yes gene_type:complete
MAPAHSDTVLLHQIPANQASLNPAGVALWWQGQAITYAALNDRVEQLVQCLSTVGVRGDRVAMLSWNRPEFVELIYAASASGRLLVPLNARLASAELVYQLRHAGVTRLIGDQALLAPLRSHAGFPKEIEVIALGDEFEQWLHSVSHSAQGATLPPVQHDDPVWILYTSGSTGRPKGAVLTHRSFAAGLRSAAIARPVQASDRYFYPFPLFHVAAHNVLLQHQYGAAVVLAPGFDAGGTLAACRELSVTSLSLAPTMLAMLLEHPDFCPSDLESVRTIGYGASAMPYTLLQRLLSNTEVGLCQSYGMTELSGSIAFLTVEDHREAVTRRPELLRSVGKPLPHVRVKLVDDAGQECAPGRSGEICVLAKQCMSGYWQQPEETAQALVEGWLHSGDIGRFDDAGYLYIVDRKKDMIVTGGENVASREVEEVLRQHPAVRDCAVIGVPDDTWGECVCAVVVEQSGVSDEELATHCRAQLAGYKTPRKWVRQMALPLNAAGKVDKPLLRTTVAA